MKNHTSHQPATQSVSSSVSRRLLYLISGGSLVSFGAGTQAQAAVVPAGGIFPLSPPNLTGPVVWDVDGNGTIDFQLYNTHGPAAFLSDMNGGRVVATSLSSHVISKLNAGFVVGPTLAGAFEFPVLAKAFISITHSAGIGDHAQYGGWAYGDTGYFGFKFTSGANTYYGWGEMNIGDRGAPGAGDNFQINSAYFNNTPNAPISVGTVPEPSAAVLLALGATGLATWRRRKQAA